MAYKYYSPLDLAKNELLNARIQNLGSAPSSPVTGQLYFNTTAGGLEVYDGSVWTVIGEGVTLPIGQADVTNLTSDLALLAPKASPTFTGTVTIPTPTAGDNTTKAASTAFVSGAIADLVGTAPELLNTLGEISDALGDNANLASVLTDAIALKANTAAPVFTGDVTLGDTLVFDDLAAHTTTFVQDDLGLSVTGAGTFQLFTDFFSIKKQNGDQGIVTDGIWNGTVIGVTYGGTGAATAAGGLNNLLPAQADNAGKVLTTDGTTATWETPAEGGGAGTVQTYSTSIGDGTATSYVVTHNFNTRDISVTVAETATPWATIGAEVQRTTVNTVTVLFSTPPTTNQFRVTVQGAVVV